MDVYRERAYLIAHLTVYYPCHFHLDPHEPDFPILYMETSMGQMSWHISSADLDVFGGLEIPWSPAAEWDGHSTEDKYERLYDLTRVDYAMRNA